MVTKWATLEIRNFNDVPKFLDKRYHIFKSTASSKAERPYLCKFTMHVIPRESIWIRRILMQPQSSDNWPLPLPFEQVVELLVEYRVPHHETSTKMDASAKSAFEEGKTYYERNKALLTRKYNGEYIAVWHDEVIDHDVSFSTLAQRVYKKLGYVSIYMPFVTSKRRVLRFESPERRSANVS